MTTLLYLWHVCQCLIVDLLFGFIEHLLRFVLSIKLFKSFLHELFPHFLCLRHQASLDDITHVAKSVRSVRRGLCGVKWGINESTVKHLNYFYNRIILVLLYQNYVKVNSGLVFLYMYMQFDIHICGTLLSALWSQAWLRNHVI